jgi:hypothetical protein
MVGAEDRRIVDDHAAKVEALDRSEYKLKDVTLHCMLEIVK